MATADRRLFVCVYRRYVPRPSEWRRTTAAAVDSPRLAEFLDQYWSEGRYLDWGDDPAFFCATETYGDPRYASWGVCRPDVRTAARVGDGVAFFYARPHTTVREGIRRATGPVDYFYVGFGTVGKLVTRNEVWADPTLASYRNFFNLLVRPDTHGRLHHSEKFFPQHKDWAHRCAAPMVLFDPERTAFNVDSPLHVAHYKPHHIPEQWYKTPASEEVEQLLFEGVKRRLRTSHSGFGHAKRVLHCSQHDFGHRRSRLLAIARATHRLL